MTRAISRLNPYIMVLYYVLIMVLSVMVKHPMHLAALFVTGIAMAVIVAGWRVSLRMLGYGFIMSALIILINPLVSKEGVTHIIEWGDFFITRESIVYGAISALMLMTVMMWFVSFNVIMTGDKYIYVLGRALPSLALLISLTLRLIPEQKRDYDEIKMHARSLGLFGDKGIIERCRLSIYALKRMIRRSIDDSVVRADSMTARGYGIAHRSCYLGYRWRMDDSIYLASTLILGGMAIAGHVLGHSFAGCYPIINIQFGDTYTIVSLFVVLALGCLPLLFETKEAVAWKRYLSRISA